MKLRIFPGIIFVMIGMNFVIVGITIFAATRGESWFVPAAYERRDVGHEVSPAFSQNNWTADLNLIRGAGTWRLAISLSDETGQPIDDADIRITCFHHAYAAHRQILVPRTVSGGEYIVELPTLRQGLWRFELAATRRDEHFERSKDLDIPEGL